MSQIILKRKDASGMLKSYKEVYDLSSLSSIEEEYRKIILRIVKKSILGCNYCYSYIKNKKKSYERVCLSLISLSYNLHSLLDSLTDFYKGEDEKNLNNGDDWAKYITFAWTIITLVQQMVLIFKEDKKEENMKKYMEIFTQRAINEENEKMKNKYFCEISKDGNFDIIINKINNDNNSQVKYQSYFSKYVINIPNVDETSLVANHIYSAIFSKMDEEFVVLVMVIFIAIENSNRKKLLKFIQISVIISIIIPLYNFYYPENTIKNLNLYFFITNALLAIYNIFNFNLKNKNQKRAFISVINEIFISKGYFINMNDDIISIFALKDEYIFNNNIKRIADIDERKCNLLLP